MDFPMELQLSEWNLSAPPEDFVWKNAVMFSQEKVSGTVYFEKVASNVEQMRTPHW